MYDTVEVRWILDGPLPAQVETWFGYDGVLTPETRTDHYVVMRACSSWVGIKLRGSASGGPTQVDVKARCGEEVELRLAPAVTGRAAAWSKWTLELAHPEAIVSGFEPDSPTLTTHKRRLLRRLVRGDAAREIPPAQDAKSGCDVELATITVEDSDLTWWSLGFEAFGPSDRAWASLRAIGAEWFERHGAPPLAAPSDLDMRTSTDYPRWLADRLADR
jgi:hypothetical protein